MNGRIITCTLAIIFLLFSPKPAIAQDLWSDAVATYQQHAGLVPGRMVIRFDQYNGRGKLVSAEYSEIEIRVAPNGEIAGTTVYASRDGEDITAERQDGGGAPPFAGSGDGESDGDSPFAGLSLSPFDPDEQQRVVVTDTGRSEVLGGTVTRMFRYRHSTSEKFGTTGTVWIDPESGAPVRLTGVIEPLPGYVNEFEMIQEFDVDSDGRWYLARMRFMGEGNILFVRRRIESEFAFGDYFAPPSTTIN